MEGNKGYNDLFVCFPSRTSMRTVPKSVHSPGRLEKYKECGGSASFGSRRKGQSSPMFPLLLRRRNAGSSSETTAEEEPTSPKVTCIGQVRVKSKHAGKGTESLRNFRKEVCDAFKSLGAEFSCIFPCNGGTPTSPNDEEVDRKHSSACGSALLAKFVMILNDGDGKHHGRLDPDGRRQEKGLDSMKMEDPFHRAKDPFGKMEHPYDKNQERMRKSLRRFHDDNDEDDWIPAKSAGDYCRGFSHVGEGEDEDEPICVPPRNALLLMRCRSAPLRLSLNSDCWMAHSNADEPQNKGCVVESNGEDLRLTSSGDEDEVSNDEEARETTEVKGSGETENKSLPQGLLLMQCEPELTKLSLEVSKETWVPTRDFFMRPMVSQDGSRRLSKESSDQEECSKRGTTNMPDEGFSPPEAFMLKRCKSEPHKVSLKLAPEACLWKRRNLGKPLALKI